MPTKVMIFYFHNSAIAGVSRLGKE